jgi:hypothetical protein
MRKRMKVYKNKQIADKYIIQIRKNILMTQFPILHTNFHIFTAETIAASLETESSMMMMIIIIRVITT